MLLLTTFTVLSTGTQLLSNSEAHVYVQLMRMHLNVVLEKKKVKGVQSLEEETDTLTICTVQQF